jgi:acyl-CoA thioesterase-1
VSITIAAWLRRALLCASLIAGSATAAAPAAILVLGDSLSAEYGLPRDTGWVRLLADRIAKEGRQYIVVNASISGETTSGGRSRLPQLLKQHRPAVVVLQLGANDGLRGLPLAAMRENLAVMISAIRAAGSQVLLVGIRIPPNYGRDYSERFAAVYTQLARDEKLPLVPFLLDGFAEDLTYFQADRIHPSERAQPRMLETVWPRLAPLLSGKRSAGTPRVRLDHGPAPSAA